MDVDKRRLDEAKRVVIMGADQRLREGQVERFPRDDFSNVNLREYDIVVLNLLSPESLRTIGIEFWEYLNPSIMLDILWHEGLVIIVGDPRIEIPQPSFL